VHTAGSAADAIRLVVIARTTPVKATDLPTFVDLSAAASDASIIDVLRKSLDQAGAETHNWGAVALLVSAAPGRTKPTAPWLGAWAGGSCAPLKQHHGVTQMRIDDHGSVLGDVVSPVMIREHPLFDPRRSVVPP